MVQSEHEHSGTNSKLIATPPKPSMTTNHKKLSFNWLPRIEQTGDPGGKENGDHKPDQTTRVHRDTTNLHPRFLHSNDLEEIQQPPMPADYSIPQLQNINSSVSTPAGHLVHFLPNWKKLTSDWLVWQIVEGYSIPLRCVPHQW